METKEKVLRGLRGSIIQLVISSQAENVTDAQRKIVEEVGQTIADAIDYIEKGE